MLSAFTSGMGGTIADIGLVIALGTVTGTLLEKSGAAETMAKIYGMLVAVGVFIGLFGSLIAMRRYLKV